MSAWDIIVATVADEFSDMNDIEMATRVILKMLLATLLGGLLGYEREQRGKAAGLRTHMLVCLGATLFILATDPAGTMTDAMSRVIQGIVAGVGFLCAGTILKGDRPGDVQGLTTAAGIWFTAAIGVSVGLGYEVMAIVGAVLALIILYVLPVLEKPGRD